MDQQGLRSFWTNMPGQRPPAEAARNPSAVLRRAPDELMVMAVPALPPLQSDSLLDAEKTGSVLLFSGLLLALVGVTFAIMGWYRYQASSRFEWTQLLGPILISVGGTFMLTSFCKLGILSCRACEEAAAVRPAMEQTTRGHPRGINPAIMLHSATTMVCIPPTDNMITQDVWQAVERQPGDAYMAPPPPCGAIYYVDNAAFTAEEDSSAHRGGRTEKTEDGGGRGSTWSRPPAYEDIFPSFNNQSLH